MRRLLLPLILLLFAAPALAVGGQSPVGDRYSASPLVIGGTVVTPQGARPHAWLVIDKGRIVQHGTPRAVLEAPAAPLVASLVGEAGLRLLAVRASPPSARATPRVGRVAEALRSRPSAAASSNT